jgi:Ras-related protein Rab-23
MLWDTAGQEEFDALTKAYYRVSDGCVLAFSTIDRNSFDAVEKWKKKVEYECGSIPMVLCQNKCDMMDQSRVPSDCVERLAKSLNLPVFMTSSKNNVNIDRGECHARRFMLIASSRS